MDSHQPRKDTRTDPKAQHQNMVGDIRMGWGMVLARNPQQRGRMVPANHMLEEVELGYCRPAEGDARRAECDVDPARSY